MAARAEKPGLFYEARLAIGRVSPEEMRYSIERRARELTHPVPTPSLRERAGREFASAIRAIKTKVIRQLPDWTRQTTLPQNEPVEIYRAGRSRREKSNRNGVLV